MLISLLLIGYTLLTAYILGLLFLHTFKKWLHIKTETDEFSFTAISGLCWLAIVLSIQHIFVHIGLWSHLLVWFINALLWTTDNRYFYSAIQKQFGLFRNKPRQVLILYSLFLFGAIINIMARPAVGDAADYHFQAIRWMEEYKVVPGIGNIRRQLGNNSNWFLLNAFFGFSFTGLRSVYALNASLLMIATVFFAGSVEKFLAGTKEKYFIVKVMILAYLMLSVFRKYVGAVTNDYAITVFTLFVFTTLLDSSAQDIFKRMMLVFFIAVMVTFKLSALPMVLLALLILYKAAGKLNIKIAVGFGVVFVMLLTPWIYTNIMHCGYPAFPISTIDIIDADWKMRKSVLEWEVMANLAWARVPNMDVAVSSTYSFAQWFPLWIKSLDGFSKFLLCGAIVSSSLMLMLFSIKKYRKIILDNVKDENVFIIITIAVALYLWFTHGPTPRFVFAYLVFLLSAQFRMLNHIFEILGKTVNKLSKHVFLLIAAIFFVSCTVFLPSYFTVDSFAGSLIVPRKYTEVIMKRVELAKGYMNVPEANGQCWDSPLPCTSLPDTTLMWRGETMEEGFKIK